VGGHDQSDDAPTLAYPETTRPFEPADDLSLPSPLPAGAEPTLPDRYRVLGDIGRGGMGRVLDVQDEELRRTVAVKVLIDAGRADAESLRRFVAEAQITAQLEHPGIVPLYDVGTTEEGFAFFVMRKVDGPSLATVLSGLRSGDPATRERWNDNRLLAAFVQVCHAVAYAHDHAVLHRDLKPDNIMLGAFGEVLVLDWGIAALFEAGGEATQRRGDVERPEAPGTLAGITLGTPGYMSPEQAHSTAGLDARTDVWSLGAILYEILTRTLTYEGTPRAELLRRTVQGPPEDPRSRAPQRAIDEEIAGICMAALAADRGSRTGSAGELAAQVQAYLDGTRRRAKAIEEIRQAEAHLEHWRALGQEQATLVAREAALSEAIPPWLDLESPQKQELVALRRRLIALTPERAGIFADAEAAAERALTHDPGNVEARRLLAQVFFSRFEEAERTGDLAAQWYFERRVVRFDDGSMAALRRGTGAISLSTDPPGARVLCRRVIQTDPVWTLGPQTVLGHTPLEAQPLEMGSWLLRVQSTGCRDTLYPVLITRGRHWEADEPIPLFSNAEIGPSSVYVPRGPFLCGGDPEVPACLPRSEPVVDGFFMSALHVTVEEYVAYLNDLHRGDPDEAWARAPRTGTGLQGSGGQYFERPGRRGEYVIPEVDREGDRWHRRWAAMGVSWGDAAAYVAWRAEREGLPWSLPTELQCEKAGRGVDGRWFPWGNGFDASLCKMQDSRPVEPQPEPVGTFATDVSIYGVRDLGGGARDWCAERGFDGNPGRRPVRGGSWRSWSAMCRLAWRSSYPSWSVNTFNGFRLVRPASR